ncbi:c-type cytochrome domain-containing protein [Adhaeribacter soli]|nr:c-type cytochrome domain-containing protein [Adhaeribacter soli]
MVRFSGKLWKAGLMLMWLAVTISCKHEIPVQPENPANPNNPNNPNNPGQLCDPNTVYFERDVLPILLSNCTMSGCHNANDREEGVVLDSYNSVMTSNADVRPGDPEGSDLYERITETDSRKRMPYNRPPLSAANIETIRKWIAQGAKNETCSTVTCDSTNVTYSRTIFPIIQSNCLGCHSGASASGGLNYSTHAGLAAVARNGRLVGAVSHKAGYKSMPQGGNKLSDCNITLIKKWVRDGALNN